MEPEGSLRCLHDYVNESCI